MANTLGTKNKVATVANNNPPITARPSGAFCSPPSPKPKAIGTIPMIIASAVISTGRTRVYPAETAACSAGIPSSICSRAKLTIKIELAVATPMHMMAPVSAGTERVVWVANSIQTMPANAAGKGVETLHNELYAYSKQSVEESISATKALLGSKSAHEAFELQTGFAKSAFDTYVSQVTKLGEIMSASAKETFEPLQGRIQAWVEIVQSSRAV